MPGATQGRHSGGILTRCTHHNRTSPYRLHVPLCLDHFLRTSTSNVLNNTVETISVAADQPDWFTAGKMWLIMNSVETDSSGILHLPIEKWCASCLYGSGQQLHQVLRRGPVEPRQRLHLQRRRHSHVHRWAQQKRCVYILSQKVLEVQSNDSGQRSIFLICLFVYFCLKNLFVVVCL